MDFNMELEACLSDHYKLESTIKRQKNKLKELEAHRNTMLVLLSEGESPKNYPVYFEMDMETDLIEIQDEIKFYIYNIGDKNSCTETQGILVPTPYCILRKFSKSKLSRSASEEIFYTSSIHVKDGSVIYTIKDEENNIWTGANVFEKFINSFDSKIPFFDIKHWFGLYSPQVRAIFRN